MATASVISAVIEKYGTLTAANFPSSTRPAIWLDEAPQETGAGAQQRVPYVILRDGGGQYDWDGEVNGLSPGKFSLDVYANTMADCDTILAAILWNGATPNLKSGLAFTTLGLTAPLYGMAMGVTPTTSHRGYAGLDYLNKRVHRVTQDFEVIHQTRGTG